MKPSLLIINKLPFGSLTDSYKWCEYLRHDFNITFVCFSSEEEDVQMEGVNIHHVSYKGCLFLRGVRFLLVSLWYALFSKGKILIVYFEHCDILKRLLPWKKMIIDVRTLAVWGSQADQDAYDNKLKNVCEKFDYVSLISEGIKKRLSLQNRNVSILPLGSDIISLEQKDYSKIHLLYVGTFLDRHIEETIYGLNIFLSRHKEFTLTYDIIGEGSPGELDKMKDLVHQLHLDDFVTLHGRISHSKLQPFFDRATIGVSYVPITSAFNVQPVTKTFEYSNSGLFVIGTSTEENKKVITSSNGVLINDSAEDFADALDYYLSVQSDLKEEEIRMALNSFSWKNIVTQKLKPIIEQD